MAIMQFSLAAYTMFSSIYLLLMIS